MPAVTASASPREFVIVGAGLAGALLASLLARQGHRVDVYERRGDSRVLGYERGRSINLALTERGRHALRIAGLEDEVMAKAVMMRGRMVHLPDAAPQLQRYGRDDSEVIWSVHRGDLNISLLDQAERSGARLHFGQRLDGVDFERREAGFIDDAAGTAQTVRFTTLIGADGAGSALRAAMQGESDLGERVEPLDHSYKELEIPPGADGGFRIEPNALHIWPCGHYMLIALPNVEGTFTVTLFMPNAGEPSFEAVRTPEQALALFRRDFPTSVPLIPDLQADWTRNPVGMLATLYLDRWHLDERAVLLGDAAHAMVPFHGQGMNCAFEDCLALARQLQSGRPLAHSYAAFEAERKPNADAIQRMALENYHEMRDRVDDADYLLQRELETLLQRRHPLRFVPHYTMVSFMRIPYAMAESRSDIQREILQQATDGLDRIDAVDLARVDAEVNARLEPLAEAA